MLAGTEAAVAIQKDVEPAGKKRKKEKGKLRAGQRRTLTAKPAQETFCAQIDQRHSLPSFKCERELLVAMVVPADAPKVGVDLFSHCSGARML